MLPRGGKVGDAKVQYVCFAAVRLLSNQDKQLVSDLCLLGQVSWDASQHQELGRGGNRWFYFKLVPFRRERVA